eukprot:7011573-Alexandrium_andersonii.AAC.2
MPEASRTELAEADAYRVLLRGFDSVCPEDASCEVMHEHLLGILDIQSINKVLHAVQQEGIAEVPLTAKRTQRLKVLVGAARSGLLGAA